MKTPLCIAIVLALAAALAPGQETFRPEEVLVSTALRKTVERVDLDDVALADALTVLGEMLGVNITVDWKALAAAEVRRDTPVTVHLKGVPAEQALRLALTAAAGPGTLDFVVRGRGIVVGPPEALKALGPLPKPAKGDEAKVVAPGEGRSDADRAALAKLQTAIPVLLYKNIRLEDALLYLRRITGVSMYIDWAGLKTTGASPATRITAQRKNTTAALALQTALAKAAPGKLGYAVAGGIVMIATPARLDMLVAAAVKTRGTDAPEDRATVKKLKTNLSVLRQNDTRLQTMLTFLARAAGTNLYVNWRAVKAAGIKPTASVSLDLKNVSVELAMLLALVDAGGPKALDFSVAGGIVLVSTADDAPLLAQYVAAAPPVPHADIDKGSAAKLEEKFPVFRFDDVSLKVAVQFLREAAGVNIFADWRSLKPLGATPDTTVHVDLKGVTCRTTLRLILVDVAGTGKADYLVSSGVVYLSTPQTLKKLEAVKPL